MVRGTSIEIAVVRGNKHPVLQEKVMVVVLNREERRFPRLLTWLGLGHPRVADSEPPPFGIM